MPELSPTPKALIFDVFGTVVDWRTTVEQGLHDAASRALAAQDSSTSESVRKHAESLEKSDWAKFAQEWRTNYMEFCRSLANNEDAEWKTVDEHHLDSLKELIVRWDLQSLWTADEIKELSLIWHDLATWKDSVPGLRSLSGICKTATLSNGNTSLLRDLVRNGNLAFDRVFSCEEFKTYKPNPKTYKGAVQHLGFKPGECAMVAAHLFDLQAAKKCGLRTIYIARPREEEVDKAAIEKVRKSGDIDLWIEEHEDGLITMCKSLGVSV